MSKNNCQCLKKIIPVLEESGMKNPVFKRDLISGKTYEMVGTDNGDVRVFHSNCPFCGVKYDE